MSRALRIEYPGAFYHVTARGNERKAIFKATENYEKFIGYLQSATERYGAKIHCFCFMPNHYHLLLETPRGNLHTILHHLPRDGDVHEIITLLSQVLRRGG
jgi:REP element-mobilizing transposase RayT